MKKIKFSFFVFILIFAFGDSYSQKLPKAVLTVCENTDEDSNPINPRTTLKVGEHVVFQISFPEKYKISREKEPAQFIIAWEVFKVNDEGQDEKNVTDLRMIANSLFRKYATAEFQTFSYPGKYRVYALPWEMRDDNYKTGNYKDYFGKTEIEVVE
ncbi:MAG: hypothetical protein JNJ56_08210 [Ignavibacteria bacterium]|nr:hypothetical protein [Ignavibacteria bacterium]